MKCLNCPNEIFASRKDWYEHLAFCGALTIDGAQTAPKGDK